MENGKVYFNWKNYRNNSEIKPIKLDVEEFMRRFLLHILPKGFVRIRFYGFLCNRKKKENIKHIRKLLGEKENGQDKKRDKENTQMLLFRLTGIDISMCPACKKGHLITIKELLPQKYFYHNIRMDSS